MRPWHFLLLSYVLGAPMKNDKDVRQKDEKEIQD
jgi:hypothetical protein